MQDAKYILKRLDSTGQTELSKRDLYQLCRSKAGFETITGLDGGLSVLSKMGYIRIAKVRVGEKGGRPSERVFLNPEYTTQNPQYSQY